MMMMMMMMMICCSFRAQNLNDTVLFVILACIWDWTGCEYKNKDEVKSPNILSNINL